MLYFINVGGGPSNVILPTKLSHEAQHKSLSSLYNMLILYFNI